MYPYDIDKETFINENNWWNMHYAAISMKMEQLKQSFIIQYNYA